MHGLVHILTMVAFAVHAVVGCCLHHHHESSHEHEQQIEGVVTLLTCHHHHGSHREMPQSDLDDDNADSSGSQLPCEDSPCDESPCAFQAEPLNRLMNMLISLHWEVEFSPLLVTSHPQNSSSELLWGDHLLTRHHADAQSLRAALQIWVV